MESVISGSSDDEFTETLNIKPPQIINTAQASRSRSPRRNKRKKYYSSDSAVRSHSPRRAGDNSSRRKHRHHRRRRAHNSHEDLRKLLIVKQVGRHTAHHSAKRIVVSHEVNDRSVDKLRVKVERQVMLNELHSRPKHFLKSDSLTGHKHSRQSSADCNKKQITSSSNHSLHRKRHRMDRSASRSIGETESSSSDNSENCKELKDENENLSPKENGSEPMEVVVSSSSEDSEESSDDSSSTKTADTEDSDHQPKENGNDSQNVSLKNGSNSSDSDAEGNGNDSQNVSLKNGSKSSDSDAEGNEEVLNVADSPKCDSENDDDNNGDREMNLSPLPPYLPAIQGCRSVEEFQCLNKIEEGAFGVVYRARDKTTQDIVALKKLKMAKEKEGFPITALREINTLLKSQHPNIVTVREIVVGSNMDQVFIVMDFVEQDLNALMRSMKKRNQMFLQSEVKCLMQQLLLAVAHLHDNWILHRDLKTSNLLLDNRGVLKIGDFGLAREYGSPLKSYTPLVVTLWYRSPELLLAPEVYSTHVDIWAVGCVFGELITLNALFPGKTEAEQITRIFKDLGTPTETTWPGFSSLPMVQRLGLPTFPVNQLWTKLGHVLSDAGMDLMNKFLTYNPAARITAEAALKHKYFLEPPVPTLPSKAALEERKPGKEMKSDDGFRIEKEKMAASLGFSLKF